MAVIPDVIAVRDGCIYALELKAPGRRLSESQRATHNVMTKAGVQVAVADKAALRAAKARGVVLGGMTANSLEHQRQAREHAERLRDVFAELSDLSARKAAETLNARGIPTPEAGKWYATQVIRVRKRLAEI